MASPASPTAAASISASPPNGVWLQGEDRELALVLVDADAFNAAERCARHLYGDECLRRAARICTRFASGSDDLVARFGGEELVLLLPGRDLQAAAALAEEVRREVEAIAMPHDNSQVAPIVTVSAGVSAVRPSHALAPEQLIDAADARAVCGQGAGPQSRRRTLGGLIPSRLPRTRDGDSAICRLIAVAIPH
jgi:diguanylate cyclase (GGDEF)-like protein